MEMPDTYDEWTVYVPHTQVTKYLDDDHRDAPSLDDVLMAGYKALGFPMEAAWIETDFMDTHGV